MIKHISLLSSIIIPRYNYNIFGFLSTSLSFTSIPAFSRFSISSAAPVNKVRAAKHFSTKSMSTPISPALGVEQVLVDNGPLQAELLTAIDDDHGGVMVYVKEPMNSRDFASSLKASMLHWRQQGKKGVWIKLPIELVNLVEAAVKEGFWYHHAEPEYLMLVYWIPETGNTIPSNATHRVGIGAFVMNDKREVLT
ncbi:Nudix hydrolase, partial [Thalictrum thalictroides]